ncbi:MAG: helix-turn-helix transcriptional regulator [Hyphomonadaceae bacterium]|nr:helix-turn-helix transcriptional regulator [Hyphomonadaceae bacterium]MBC6412069.1 helix-turn-helix transcriptional regulator [Hyphomonadaceae bacterium]
MPLPPIYVTDIESGLSVVRPGITYFVPTQNYSAIYLPESAPIRVLTENKEEFDVETGGMIAFPMGMGHQIFLGKTPTGTAERLQPPFGREELKIIKPDEAVLFCSRVPTSANPLPDIIPSVLCFSARKMRQESRLDLMFRLIRNNTLRPSDERFHITARLAEIVAIILVEYVLRNFKEEGIDVINGAATPSLRRVLNAIHERPEHSWTLAELADEAAMSRSVFAEKFKDVIGQPAMKYLTRVRMSRAMRLLRSGELPVAEIAYRTGYKSDSAFNKAFEALFGLTPAKYRKKHLCT